MYGDHRYLHVLTPSFPTRRSSDLGLTRTYMKRKLLDQLAAAHDFDVPPTMVEAEFNQIWQQLEHEASHEEDPEAAKAELEKDRDDYRSEEHTSELQSLMRISYAVFCLKKKTEVIVVQKRTA